MLKLASPGTKMSFSKLQGQKCNIYWTKNVRNFGSGVKSVIFPKFRGAKCKISSFGRWFSVTDTVARWATPLLGERLARLDQAFDRAPGVQVLNSKLQTLIPGSYSDQICSSFFLNVQNHEGNKSPQSISWKYEKIKVVGRRWLPTAAVVVRRFSGDI